MPQQTKSDLINASVTEFCNVWELGGESVLRLESRGGHCNLSVPSDPRPAPRHDAHCHDSRPRRHRGPAAKERSRKRAALYQEKLRNIPPSHYPSPPPPPPSPPPPPPTPPPFPPTPLPMPSPSPPIPPPPPPPPPPPSPPPPPPPPPPPKLS